MVIREKSYKKKYLIKKIYHNNINMVFTFIADVALETGWWVLKQTYNAGYYMIYETQENKEDKIIKQIEK